MSLLDLINSGINEEIEFEYRGKKQTTAVKPLTILDIAILLKHHTKEMSDILTTSSNNMLELLAQLAEQAPAFLVAFIKLGLAEDISEDKLAELPFSLQVRLADEIWRLSVLDTGYLGKLVGRIVKSLGDAAQVTADRENQTKQLKEELDKQRKALEKSGKDSSSKSSKS